MDESYKPLFFQLKNVNALVGMIALINAAIFNENI
jgi:hypothetical protein